MGGDNDGFFGVSIFEDLEQGEAEVLVEWLEAEVVKDEQGYFFDLVEDFDIRAVEFGGCDFFDEAVHVEIERFVAHLAGMSEGLRTNVTARRKAVSILLRLDAVWKSSLHCNSHKHNTLHPDYPGLFIFIY